MDARFAGAARERKGAGGPVAQCRSMHHPLGARRAPGVVARDRRRRTAPGGISQHGHGTSSHQYRRVRMLQDRGAVAGAEGAHRRDRDDARLGDRVRRRPRRGGRVLRAHLRVAQGPRRPRRVPQMDTGPTKLGFATYALARGNFDGGVRPAGSDGPPPSVEIALVAEDVDAAYKIAVDAGCEPLAAPADKPQGQRVGYLRPVRDAGRARHATVDEPARVASEQPLPRCARSKRFRSGPGRYRKGRVRHLAVSGLPDQLSSERTLEPVRQDSSFAEKHEFPPALLRVVRNERVRPNDAGAGLRANGAVMRHLDCARYPAGVLFARAHWRRAHRDLRSGPRGSGRTTSGGRGRCGRFCGRCSVLIAGHELRKERMAG